MKSISLKSRWGSTIRFSITPEGQLQTFKRNTYDGYNVRSEYSPEDAQRLRDFLDAHLTTRTVVELR